MPGRFHAPERVFTPQPTSWPYEMTNIHFLFNAPDRLLAACGIAARRLQQGSRLAVYCRNNTRLAAFDQMLWEYERTAFVPHVHADDPLASQTPIVLYGAPPPAAYDWVLNLDDDCLPETVRYAHIVEIVARGDVERAAGRARWRHYQSAGHTIVQHDLATNDLP